MATSPGVDINVPPQAEHAGPIPIQVSMVADMPTHFANNGIPDEALDIVMVRRDGPGVSLVPTLDPSAIMLPDEPLPPPPPGTDPANAGFISEERTFDVLDFGAEHDGAADYYVFAAFAGRLSPLRTLSINHPSHRLPDAAGPVAARVDAESSALIVQPPPAPGVLANCINDGELRVEGGLRVERKASRFSEEEFPPAFVTIVAVNIIPTGGISGASFVVPADVAGQDYVGRFSIPLNELAPNLEPGQYYVLVFSGDHQARPINVTIE